MIRVLPQQVADAIAAGEVVERPASVVKELVENAIDAGAHRISVEIRGAGRSLIRVADDGVGIPPDELRLAFQRHATSKVASLSDLASISSLGFRGEALASAAAVSDLECRSRGASIRLRWGDVVEEGPAMPTPGTVLEVRDLFTNTPARLKFLKADSTEASACLRVVQSYALLYPEIRFEVLVESRTSLRTLGTGDQRNAVSAIMGGSISQELLQVDSPTIAGVISQPSLSRGSRDSILLAVNRRPISSRSLSFAVEECYLGALERGRYPIAVLNLTVAAEDLDVNVHPSKREVRFHAERAVFADVQQAVRGTLQGSQPVRFSLGSPSMPTDDRERRPMAVHEATPIFSSDPGDAPSQGHIDPQTLRSLGQVVNGYLVAEGADGVVLVDQHAAHERILFNRFLARLEAGAVASQPLLLPETVDLDPVEMATLPEKTRLFRDLGFEVDVFGPGSVRLLAGPAEVLPSRIEEAFRDLLAVMTEFKNHDLQRQAAASLACHSAVRFGDTLDSLEQQRLLRELTLTEDSLTCPHGRPTRLVLDWQDLKRHFRRNY